ncbi:MAG: hypothetical protein M1817_006523 [Caeruleum heppii]|nr:MAG: hypothetical protein M1817_006523 [Caeruleum heppii]
MATVQPASARRRVLTYGKSSRKRADALRDVILGTAFDEIDPIVHRQGSRQHTESPRKGQKLPWSASYVSGQTKLSNATIIQPSHSSSTRNANMESDRQQGISSDNTTAKGALSRPTDRAPARSASGTSQTQDLAVFDFPSSDDDVAAPSSTARTKPINVADGNLISASYSSIRQGGARDLATTKHTSHRHRQWLGSKKTKTAHTSSSEDAVAQFDDDALQRHVAMETSLDGASPATLLKAFKPRPTNTISAKPRAAPVESANPRIEQGGRAREASGPADHQQHGFARLAPGPEIAAKVSHKSRSTNETSPSMKASVFSHVDILRTPPAKVRQNTGLSRETRPEQPIQHPSSPMTPQTPPNLQLRSSSAVSPSTVKPRTGPMTTPRQLDLWTELLDDSGAHQSPSGLKLRNLSITGTENVEIRLPASPSITDADEDLEKPAQGSRVCVRSAARKRLIDSLAHESRASPSDDEDSVDESVGRSGGRTPNNRSSSNPTPIAFDRRASPEVDIEIRNASQGSSADTQPVQSQTSTIASAEGPKITYARQRTFLTESGLTEDQLLNTPLDMSGLGQSGTGRRRLAQLPVIHASKSQHDGEDDVVGDSAHGTIRSIHELREAGNNKRFLDESEALFEDIEGSRKESLSRRRNGFLELATKLFDKAYARRFLSQSMDRRLFVSLEKEEDLITGFILASSVTALIQEGMNGPAIAHLIEQGIGKIVCRLLSVDRDINAIARNRQSNMSKVAQAAVFDFRKLIGTAVIGSSEIPDVLSPQLMGLICLESLIKKNPTSDGAKALIKVEMMDALTEILSVATEPTTTVDRPNEIQSQLPLVLRILDYFTLTLSSEAAGVPLTRLAPSHIRHALLALSDDARADSGESQTLILRVLLNVSNNDAAICEEIGTSEIVEMLFGVIDKELGRLRQHLDEKQRLGCLDYLILALAGLTNLAEWSVAVRRHVFGGEAGKGSVLDGLAQHFVRGLGEAAEADSVEKTHSNVAFGYLAVLLGTLCLDRHVKIRLATQLPGRTLQPLSNAVREFQQYHQKVDADAQTDEQGPNRDGFSGHLQEMVVRLMRT